MIDSNWTADDIYLGHSVRENQFPPFEKSVLYEPWHKDGGISKYGDPRHIVSIGPNGAGKTRRLLTPNLCSPSKRSILVVDPKGELAVCSAKHRAENGSQIVTFDPFGVIERRYPDMVKELPYLKSKGFNPLAMLDPLDDEFPDDAKALSEALIYVEGRDSHWAQSAQALLTGLIMGMRMTLEPDDPNNTLAGLRQVVGMAPDALGLYISELIDATASESAIAAKLNRFREISPDNRELLSILSTAVTQTDWIDSKPIRRELRGGAFDFAEMKRRPLTVYLVLPPQYLETHSRWLRLMITAVLTPLIRSTAKGVPVLFMLDEFAQLGRLEVIERNLALMRGYGVRLWLVLQDLSQLVDAYPRRWHSFIGNAGVIQSFAPQDVKTRQYLSQLSGQHRLWVWTNSQSTSRNQMMDWASPPISKTETSGRNPVTEYVYPEEALAQMEDGRSVLFEAKKAPRRTILSDPSEVQLFDTAGILSRAEDFAAQYDISEAVFN